MSRSEDIKRPLRLAIGKVIARLQGYAAQYREQQRLMEIARICRFHPTANIHEKAGFSNSSEDPGRITIGANSAVLAEFIALPQGGRIAVGQHSFVGPGSRVWSAASITIGDYVLISHNVTIVDNISHSRSWIERREEIDNILPHLQLYPHGFDLKAKPLKIEDDVWIGFGSSVIGGITIGRGAIVGAGTMVTKDVAPFSIVVGNPMRVLSQAPDGHVDSVRLA